MVINDLGKALCEALGLDPNKVRNITIRSGIWGGIAHNSVDVEMRIDFEIGLVDIFKQYELVPKEPQ